ncbi:MAG: glycosyltransferase family 4 protein [Propionicimonas sp.]
MRILHVNKYLYRRGGAEGYMLDVAELQRNAGHEVAFFGMRHPDNEPQRYEAWLPKLIELEPAPVGLRKAPAAARMIWSTSSRSGIRQVLRDFRPDVVHCHNIYHQLSPSILDGVARAGIPCVMTLHDYKLACPSYQLLDHGSLCEACVTGGPWQAARRRCKDGSFAASSLLALESWLHRVSRAYSPVDVFVSPSRFLAEVMGRAGVFPDRMRVVNHFVDLVPTSAPDGAHLVFAGRLSAEKGVDVLIEAMAMVGHEATLDIAGDGPERARLESLAGRQTASGRVTFHGRLDKQELAALVSRSTASVVPSRWHENQPMTILESFAAGVPVVATNLGGLPEVVRNGVDGWVVPAEDPIRLALALDEALSDPRSAALRGQNARERMAKDFSPGTHLRNLADAYAQASVHRNRRTTGAVS